MPSVIKNSISMKNVPFNPGGVTLAVDMPLSHSDDILSRRKNMGREFSLQNQINDFSPSPVKVNFLEPEAIGDTRVPQSSNSFRQWRLHYEFLANSSLLSARTESCRYTWFRHISRVAQSGRRQERESEICNPIKGVQEESEPSSVLRKLILCCD